MSTWTVESIQARLKKEESFYIEGLPEAIYHAFLAMSASGQKAFRKSPGDWKYMREHPSGDTDARRWGRLVHIALGEPHRMELDVAVIDGHRGGKEVKAAVEAATAAGKLVVKSEAAFMAAEVSRYCRAHPNVGLALKGGEGEKSLFWIDPETGVPCKARLDWTHKEVIFDWKTFDNVQSEDAIEKQIRDMFYDYQAAWYMEGYYRVFKKRAKNFYHVWIATEPVKVQTSFISQISLEEIIPYIRYHLKDFAVCLKHDMWPMNDEKVLEIVVKQFRN